MAGEGEEIRVQRLHIHRHMRGALRAVHDDHRALFMRHLRDFPHWIFAAQDVGNLRNGDDLRLVGEELLHLFQVQPPVRLALHELELRAGLLTDHLPRQQIAVVLHDGHQHLVPRLDAAQAVAVGDKVQALGGVAGEDDLLGALGADERPHRLARILIDPRGLHAQRVQAAQGIGIVLAVKLCFRVDDALRALRRGRVIEIGDADVAQQRKILSQNVRHLPSSSSNRFMTAPSASSSPIRRATRSIEALASSFSATSRPMPRLSK